jgi:AcrR family transcriptional regulator
MKSVAAKNTRTRAASTIATPRERVLNAAFSCFMTNGYADTSTLEIATRAKVSKRALYAVSADKAALLHEVISERIKQMQLPLAIPMAENEPALAGVLTAFGKALLQGVCTAPVLALHRLAIAESGWAPTVAKTLDRAGREATRGALRRTLEQAQAAGLIGTGDSMAMAVDFLALLWGDLLMQLLLRVTPSPTQSTLEERARLATEKFLKLYRSSGTAHRPAIS